MSALNHYIVSNIEGLRVVNYVEVAALTALLYDVTLTFTREVIFIAIIQLHKATETEVGNFLSAKWSFAKILYLLTRYYGLAFLIAKTIIDVQLNLPAEVCKTYFYWSAGASEIVFTTLVNLILVLRLHALYDRNPKVLLFLCVAVSGEFAAEFYVSVRTAIDTSKHVISAPFGLPFAGCLTLDGERPYTLAAWVPCIIVASIFFSMTLYKVIQKIKLQGNIRSISSIQISPLLAGIFKDGTIFYLIITIALIVNTITVSSLSGPYIAICRSWLFSLYSISGCRLILHLREIAYSKSKHSGWSETISANVFQPLMKPR
ncbi:hypothetical protein BDQ17DRAFT_1420402 [Cyathus striatus]|nr:hypothetical protein BDQ17DRAFT_1420402 [Cyathus striatus]